MLNKINQTAAYLKTMVSYRPETGIILGTGLGHLADEITDKIEIPYEQIPHFPLSTVEGHSGKLITRFAEERTAGSREDYLF